MTDRFQVLTQKIVRIYLENLQKNILVTSPGDKVTNSRSAVHLTGPHFFVIFFTRKYYLRFFLSKQRLENARND